MAESRRADKPRPAVVSPQDALRRRAVAR